MTRYEYHRPRTLDEAARLRERIDGALYIAGGTDVMVRIRNRAVRPTALISLRAVSELAGIEMGGETRIGAITLVADIAQHAGLRERYPVLCEAAQRLGSEQIRNAATIGGNLCNASPCADLAPALLVLDARAHIWGPTGMREVPIAEFFTGPGQTCMGVGELLRGVVLGAPTQGARTAFMKKGRVAMDLATASVAALLQMQGRTCRRARFAAGSVAPVPMRLGAVEALLEGAEVTSMLAVQARELAEQSVKPISDVRSSAQYRRTIVGVYVQRAIEGLALSQSPVALPPPPPGEGRAKGEGSG